MQFKQLFKDERAVSPVIGVILMVAITVILAAVIGTFVLGLGNNLSATAPNANFQFDYVNNGVDDFAVTATHSGGTTITSDNAASLLLADDAGSGAGGDFDVDNNDISSGSSATLTGVDANTVVRVVWTSQDGGTSQTLAEGKTPSN